MRISRDYLLASAFAVSTACALTAAAAYAESASLGSMSAAPVSPAASSEGTGAALPSPLSIQANEPVLESAPVVEGSINLDPELECVAKVVHHEAGNQSAVGQLAVAQIMVNRSRSGRFPTNLCDVANQPGQFFDVAGYEPRRNTEQWREAVAAARQALAEGTEDVTRGSYFFHSAHFAPKSFHRSRQRVVQLGDHIFYR